MPSQALSFAERTSPARNCRSPNPSVSLDLLLLFEEPEPESESELERSRPRPKIYSWLISRVPRFSRIADLLVWPPEKTLTRARALDETR